MRLAEVICCKLKAIVSIADIVKNRLDDREARTVFAYLQDPWRPGQRGI